MSIIVFFQILIRANPKTAGMRKGYSYAYSNYGIYHRLSDLLSEEKRSPADLLLGKPLVSARPTQKCPPDFPRSKRPVRKGKRVPGNETGAELRPDFARRAAAFTAANA